MKNKKYPYYTVPEPHDLKDLLRFCAETYGDHTAFWYQNGKESVTHSFRDVQNDVNAFGTFLNAQGLNGKHIGLLGENSYEWIITYFAVVNGGGVIVPVDKEQDAATIRELLKKSDVSLLIHSESYSEEAVACCIPALNLNSFAEYCNEGKQLIECNQSGYLNYPIDRENLCTIVFTSGTTGEAKGVMLNHRALICDAIGTMKNIDVPYGSVLLLPLYHTYGFMSSVILPLLVGYPVFISKSLKRFLSDIRKAEPHHLSVVPVMIYALYDSIWKNARENGKEQKLRYLLSLSKGLRFFGIDIRRKLFKEIIDGFGGNLEMLISGGSAINEQYIKGFDDLGIRVTNGYGITECSPIVATMRNRHVAPKSVGSVHSNIQCRIVDHEIQLKGDVLFIGYYHDSLSTADAFEDGWFKTGDFGYIDDSGLLYITGRKKNLIIFSNGKNVSPEEIEAELLSQPEIKEVIVYGENEHIVAEIFANETITDVKEKIRAIVSDVNQRNPMYKQITKIKYRETEFPKTSTQKIKRG